MEQRYEYTRVRERTSMSHPTYVDDDGDEWIDEEEALSPSAGAGLDWLLAITLLVVIISVHAGL